MSESDLLGWDPILMSVLGACVIQKRLALDTTSGEMVGSSEIASRPGPFTAAAKVLNDNAANTFGK